ncbi:MAG TPA: orotidine-5'-phosphate decarboxylase [Syntrophales bacterium]|nr:orotidine-5'-phosphate decarboxylase [Syntrophales bacterium]HOX94137.1 orotidine-5'-phosphate decarboxylase [Syntrophales bacterium]HPI57359.1 orotidine-5'-phosphate decarboxylase [Syntrophales bacterium]HPN25423.1 orotidine-5'-phosphate decarboxylase [Syntrophales bacterium]HQM29905.1 orotidine-5'-phosphate decarboxylase [Syntrophales bacterium]
MKTPSDEARKRLIFALDMGEDLEKTLGWVDRLKDHVGLFKIGKEAFTHFGPQIVHGIQRKGGRVFLDLKFHDIPNTVAKAAEGAVKLGVAMFNLHALGGKEMMAQAFSAAQKTAGDAGVPTPVILAVTVLTSLSGVDLKDLGFQMSPDELAIQLARMARAAGMSGVVASPREVSAIRAVCGRDFLIVTPGIRLGDEVGKDDQKRIDTPREAVRNGADYIVVGRPIRLARDPAAAAVRIVEEIALGLAEQG